MVGVVGIQKVIDEGLQDRHRILESVPATIIRFENGAWHAGREIEKIGIGFLALGETEVIVFAPRVEVVKIIGQLRPPRVL